MELAGKKVLVVGLAQTGVGVAKLAASRGATLYLNDGKQSETLDETAQALAASHEVAEVVLGAHPTALFESADLVVVSPGIPEIPAFAAARAAGAEVIAEVELAYRCFDKDATLVAITGTNGKSTTTSLIGHIAAATGRPSFCGGNLGNMPLIDAVSDEANVPGGIIVAEIAGFMLEQCTSFAPDIALLLNVTPDHLDRYGAFDIYREMKQRIFKWQTEDQMAIANLECPHSHEAADLGAADPAFFSTLQKTDAWLDGEMLRVGDFLMARADLPIIGLHNVENVLAAVLAARALGIDNETIAAQIRTFEACPHRLEKVGECGGISFYDDSKGTNVDAARASLRGFDQRVVLIAGGVHKGASYAPMLSELARVGGAVVLIGEASALIENEAAALGIPTKRASDMATAVSAAYAMAKPGDAVVLSPGCSSYDMFKNFEERGRVFQTCVQQLLAA